MHVFTVEVYVTEKGKELQTSGKTGVATSESNTQLNLSNSTTLDLKGLSEEQIAELRQQHASGMIDLHKKAAELKVDVDALDASLSTFNTQTAKATNDGTSATITHVQTSSAGRTEVMIGNTEKCKVR